MTIMWRIKSTNVRFRARFAASYAAEYRLTTLGNGWILWRKNLPPHVAAEEIRWARQGHRDREWRCL